MTQVRAWWDHIATMTVQALRAWWRLLPVLVGLYLLGFVLLEGAVLVAAMISDTYPWVALFLLSAGLVGQLATIIVSLRFLGNELGIRQQLPGGGLYDEKDDSTTRLVAITLLPFLGIYATFGKVQQAANQMVAFEIITRGIGASSVMAQMNPTTKRQLIMLIAVVVGAYIARRTVDLVHEKTDFRPLGLLAALLEGFFMLVFIFSGTQLILRARLWLLGTNLASWWGQVTDGWHTSASRISSFIPNAVAWLWSSTWSFLWPLAKAALVEPVVWLAVAALVYGSHVLSLAEMWRKGEPMTVHLDEEREITLNKRAKLRHSAGNSVVRRGWLEVQEAFFGDIDDKYLPTFQSLRLILKGGAVFLGAYVLLYALFSSVTELLHSAITWVIGGGYEIYWAAWLRLINSIVQPIGESLRLALLAVAFARTLQIFKQSADPSAVRPEAEVQQAEPTSLALAQQEVKL